MGSFRLPAQRAADALYRLPISRHNYVLVGSGPMALRNMRDIGDLDIFTTTADWFALTRAHEFKVRLTDSQDVRRRCDPPIASKCIMGIEVNCFFDWRLRWSDMMVDVTAELSNAESVPAETSDGIKFEVPCMRLEALIAWKLSAGRSKDFSDIAQIARYLTDGRVGNEL